MISRLATASACILLGIAGAHAEAHSFSERVGVQVDHVLSTDGTNVATAYAISNKIVTVGDRTVVSWLDSDSTIWLRSFDRSSGQAETSVEIGTAMDNHGGAAVTVDSKGYLHIVFGPHHGPFQYRRSVKANDMGEWTAVARFGTRCTYPSLVCGPDDTLHLTCRGGPAPSKLEYYRKPAGQDWSSPVVLAHADVLDGYTQYGNSLAIDATGTLHLVFHVYDEHPAGGKTVAYMRSEDGGHTWTDSWGRPLTLPVTPKTAEVIESGVDLDMRVSNVACDESGRPYVVVSHLETDPPTGVLWRRDETGWRKTVLTDWVRKTLGPYGQTAGGTLSIAQDGTLYLAVQLARRARPWEADSNEVGLLISRDGGTTFAGQMISPPDPKAANWLGSLERNTGHNPVGTPWLMYTHAPKDEADRKGKRKYAVRLVGLDRVNRPADAQTVRVAGIVLKWIPKQREKNFERAAKMIRRAAQMGARIVCTTESFLDGYSIRDKEMPLADYRGLAEPIPDGPYLRRLQDLAAELKIHLIAGLLERSGEATHNSAVVIGPNGKLIGRYRKQHLGHELVRNTPGNACPTFRTEFGRVGVMICADRRYPEVTEGLVGNGAEVIIVPSGGMWGPRSNDPHLRRRSRQAKLPIVFVHPIEFLVTGPSGAIWARDFRGHQMDVSPEEAGTDADAKGIFLFDLPVGSKGKPKQ